MTMFEKLRTALILLLFPPIVGVEWSALGAEISLFRSPQDSLQRAIEEHHLFWLCSTQLLFLESRPFFLLAEVPVSPPLRKEHLTPNFRSIVPRCFILIPSLPYGGVLHIRLLLPKMYKDVRQHTIILPLLIPLLIRLEVSSMVSVTPSAEAIVMPFPLAGGGVLREAMKPIRRVEIGVRGS